MAFRTVIVKQRSKIETRLQYIVIRNEEEKWIHISEIETLIIESTACVITTQALCELGKNNVAIIFCNEKHLPYATLNLLSAHYSSSGQVKIQSDGKATEKIKHGNELFIKKFYGKKTFCQSLMKRSQLICLISIWKKFRKGIRPIERDMLQKYISMLYLGKSLAEEIIQ